VSACGLCVSCVSYTLQNCCAWWQRWWLRRTRLVVVVWLPRTPQFQGLQTLFGLYRTSTRLTHLAQLCPSLLNVIEQAAVFHALPCLTHSCVAVPHTLMHCCRASHTHALPCLTHSCVALPHTLMRYRVSHTHALPCLTHSCRRNGARHVFDDFREAYAWLRHNTHPDAKVASW